MNVSQILNGPLDLNGVPLPEMLPVTGHNQALFVAGSVWWDLPDPTSGIHESPPEHIGIEVLIDAKRVGGQLVGGTTIGYIRLGKSYQGFHAAVVPAIFALRLAPGTHSLAFRNENNIGGSILQSNRCFFSVTLFDFD